MTSSSTYTKEFTDTPLWLSHHHQGQEDRCTSVGDLHLCRRCLVLYPVAGVVAVVTSFIDLTGSFTVAVGVTALLVPFLGDWVADHLDLVEYSARRSAIVSATGAVGLGLALGVHSRSPFDPWVTVPVAVACVVALTTAVAGRHRHMNVSAASDSWEETFVAEETDRRRRLEGLLSKIEDPQG